MIGGLECGTAVNLPQRGNYESRTALPKAYQQDGAGGIVGYTDLRDRAAEIISNDIHQ
jgi:hypothetical protein